MSHARSGSWSLPLLSVALVLLAASGALAVERGPASRGSTDGVAVAWPPSPDLVIGEIVTGGADASDEYVEIYNRGSLTVDLGGLELVYATATGSTVTRKASWSTRLIDPGRHELVANGSGAFGPLADDVYTGGLAATGGAVALRVIGGAVLDFDRLGHGIERFRGRRRGSGSPSGREPRTAARGAAGNGVDTNDNLADTSIQAFPIPEGSDSPPVPAPSASPSSIATSSPAASPTDAPSATPVPTIDVTPTPTLTPTSIRPRPRRRHPPQRPGPNAQPDSDLDFDPDADADPDADPDAQPNAASDSHAAGRAAHRSGEGPGARLDHHGRRNDHGRAGQDPRRSRDRHPGRDRRDLCPPACRHRPHVAGSRPGSCRPRAGWRRRTPTWSCGSRRRPI